MFRRTVTETPLTTEDANVFFSSIKGSKRDDDDSFLSTLRAVLHDIEDAAVDYRYLDFHDSYVKLSSDAAQDVRALIPESYLKPNMLVFMNFNYSDKDTNNAWVKTMREGFAEVFPSFSKVKNFAAMFVRAFEAECFVDAEHKITILFTSQIDTQKYHYIQSAIFSMLPWYMDNTSPTFNEKLDFLFSLSGYDIHSKEPITKSEANDRYMSYMSAVARRFNFNHIKIKRLLSGIEKVIYRKEIDRTENEISSTRRRISEYNDYLSSAIHDLNLYLARLEGLQSAESSRDSNELMDYFLSNKAITLCEVNGYDVTFIAKGYCQVDPDYAKSAIRKDDSFVRRHSGNSSIGEETMMKLLTKIFVDGKWKLRFCAAYTLRIGEHLRGIEKYNFGVEFDEYMPNPHIDNYSCLGGYNSTSSKALQDNNNILAIEQAIASATSLNFGDPTVMRDFMQSFYGKQSSCQKSNARCIELEDGRIVTPKEAAKIIEKEEQ